MKRSRVALIGVLTAAITPLAVTSAHGGTSPAHVAKAAKGTKVQIRKTSLGKILVNGGGLTLFMFTKDGHNKDVCVKISGCLATWPALTTSGKPRAGAGVSASKLSTIKLAGGAKQITYAGHPLYLYMFGNGPGDVSYVNQMEFGGTWEAINAAGNAVK